MKARNTEVLWKNKHLNIPSAQDPNKPLTIAVEELHRYIGICTLSSVATFLNVRLYWNQTHGLDMVKN
ncbi:hypothetical protein PR048_009050 [Dryococelus australis]|uniref:Uncharacterized protein n=1 Tax=Dryococelus australis TaxID=614101 RepID=A0ABQ9HZL4_9NEOP|nr:hypothetical protein PR048_009050 [Dryococelus australis]